MSRPPIRYRLHFVFGAALIWALFLPSGGVQGFAIDPRPPVLLLAVLGLVGFFALLGRPVGAWLRAILAIALVFLAGLQFVAAKVEQILDRPLDLYFDLRHAPNLYGLYLGASGSRGLLVSAGALAALVLVLALVFTALRGIERAAARPNFAAGMLVGSLAGLALIAVPVARASLINTGGVAVAWQQADSAWQAFAVLNGLDKRYEMALQAPQPEPGRLPGLKGSDVYLIFVESYGTVALDEPAYRQQIAPALADFAATTGAAGYQIASSRLVSPTYGGGSWLAHGTIASGVKLDPLLNELVLNGVRKSLPRYMAAAGYRTVDVMPGIKKPYPEGAFWGFDKAYYAAEIGYPGPEFGWFDIPDQFTLARFTAAELKPDHAPLFAQIVLVSSHTPFAPVPPYLANWNDLGGYLTVPQTEWPKIYAQPDWNDLDQPYLDSVAYDLKTLGQWLARLDKGALVIILGDHQPPDLTRGAGQLWTVPIHVLARDPDLIKPFLDRGYVAGALPPPSARPEGMENFLGEFLADYGACPDAPNGAARCARLSAAAPVSALPQSPDAPAVSRP